MRTLPDRSIDCILTALKLDKAIDWAEFWREAQRISKTPTINVLFTHLDLLKGAVATYSKPGDLVLDPFLGSGTTAIACQELGRHFIGGDSSPEYVAIARERVAQITPRNKLCLA